MRVEIFAQVCHRHSYCGKPMVRRYLESSDLATVDVQFLFKTGDKVLLKQHLVGKLKTKATGPYVYIWCTRCRQVAAIIGQA